MSLLLVTPLWFEALCARKGARDADVWRTGMGQARAVTAALAVGAAAAGRSGASWRGRPAPATPDLVVVLGFAGGLRDGQRAGQVVVADTLALAPFRDPVVVPAAGGVARALSGAGLPVLAGTVVSSSRLALGRTARAAAAAGGGLAVDMESWWLAGAGGLVSPRLAVVRVLSDVPGQELISPRTPAALVAASRPLVRVARALQAAAASLVPRPTEVPS